MRLIKNKFLHLSTKERLISYIPRFREILIIADEFSIFDYYI